MSDDDKHDAGNVVLSPEHHEELVRVVKIGVQCAESLSRICQALELPDTADGDQIVGAIEDLQAAVVHAQGAAEYAWEAGRKHERDDVVRWLRDRATVVRWLRDRATWHLEHSKKPDTALEVLAWSDECVDTANLIEAGEHLRGES